MKPKGFTLVEIMIVVAIIALLAAIAIPNLLRARVSAQESAAVAALHTILAAEQQFRAANPVYTDIPTLGVDNPPYVDGALATGIKHGYNFVATPNAGTDFYATAAPQALAQAHTFYVDESGVVCRSAVTNTVAPVAHVAAGNLCPAGFAEIQ